MTDHRSEREDGTVTDEPEVLPDDAEPVTDFTDDDTGDPEDDDDLDDLTPEELAALKLMWEQAKADNPAALDPDEVN
jgi:hypothetical protein